MKIVRTVTSDSISLAGAFYGKNRLEREISIFIPSLAGILVKTI